MISRANRSRRICYNVPSTPVQPMARYARSGYDRPRLDHVLGKRPMSEQRPRVVAVGEALIEFVRGGDGRFGVGCAGDSFNVAVYLARAGIDAAFATALGDDPYSDAILALAAAEGVASDLVLRTRGRLPGLTVVDADTAGTRRRYDWGADAPA